VAHCRIGGPKSSSPRNLDDIQWLAIIDERDVVLVQRVQDQLDPRKGLFALNLGAGEGAR
jgi:hypothetical protein